MRVNNGISLIWYVICGIWSLIGYKLPSYFILVLILVKNQSTMFFTIFIPYQTYRRICSGANNWFFWKNAKNSPVWRHFRVQKFVPPVSSSLMYANAGKTKKCGKPKKTAVAIEIIWDIPQFVLNLSPFLPIFRAGK